MCLESSDDKLASEECRPEHCRHSPSSSADWPLKTAAACKHHSYESYVPDLIISAIVAQYPSNQDVWNRYYLYRKPHRRPLSPEWLHAIVQRMTQSSSDLKNFLSSAASR